MNGQPCLPCEEKAAFAAPPAPPPRNSDTYHLSSTTEMIVDGIAVNFPPMTAMRDLPLLSKAAEDAVATQMGRPAENNADAQAEFSLAVKFAYLELFGQWIAQHCGVQLTLEQLDTVNDYAGDALAKKKQRALERTKEQSMSLRSTQA